jgi:hypothetical protein
MPVEIPYGAEAGMLELEAGCETAVLEHELESLITGWDEAALERICRGAVLLKQLHPELAFRACLCTAIVWEST